MLPHVALIGYFLRDLLWPLQRDIILHHVVCLCGHLYATSCCPNASRPCFIVAITVLELGSGVGHVGLTAALSGEGSGVPNTLSPGGFVGAFSPPILFL